MSDVLGIAVAAALLATASSDSFSTNSPRIIVYLGAISYPLYLLHQNIGYIIMNSLAEMYISHEVSIVVALFIMLFVASGVAIWCERPLLAYLRKSFP